MKKFLLAIFSVFLFISCNKDYEEDNWVIFNEINKNVTFSIDGKILVAAANSTNLVSALYGEYSDTPVISFLDSGTHYKGVRAWYYSGGTSYHSLTIKQQELVPFYIYYLGGTPVYVVCDKFKKADGKYKKMLLTVGTAPEDGVKEYKNSNGESIVYTIQKVYEEEIPYYIAYTLKDTATAEQIEKFKAADYIDTAEMPYLNTYYGGIRIDNIMNTYTEYFQFNPLSN